jgi:hypothetical protein
MLDYSELQDMVDYTQEHFISSGYTKSSWNNLNNTLQIAISIIMSDSAESQEHIETLINNINNAINGLVKVYQDSTVLTVGTDENNTGIFITPYPDEDLDAELPLAEQYPQEPKGFFINRLMLNRPSRWVRYTPNHLDPERAVKDDYIYNDTNTLLYKGNHKVAMMAVMENILQCRYKKQLIDTEYEITYPEGLFEPYSIDETRRVVISRINQSTLTDLQLLGNGWYQTIVRSSSSTCSGMTTPSVASESRDVNGPWGLNDGQSITVGYGNLQRAGWAGHVICAVYAQGRGNVLINGWNVGNSPALGWVSPGGWIGPGGSGGWTGNYTIGNQGGGYITVHTVRFTAHWSGMPYTYTCYSYWTNANFRSLPFFVTYDTANIVLENGSQTMARVTLYNESNVNQGNLIANQNVRSIALNNRAGQNVNIEMLCNTVGAGNSAVNWFTRVFLREVDIQPLEDVQYETYMLINHGFSDSEISTRVNADNQNGNIYRHRVGISDFPYRDNRVSKRVNNDYSNVLFMIDSENSVDGQNHLLNHHMNSNGTFVLEYGDRHLRNGQLFVKALFMPHSYSHTNYPVDSSLPVVPVLDIFYEYPEIK